MAGRESLTRIAFSGALWTASGWGVAAASQLVFGVLLARILGPEIIGIFAASLVLIRFPAIINHLGVAEALVRKPEIQEQDPPTALGVSLALSVAIGLLIWLLAPWIAGFYAMAEVEQVLRLLAFVFPIRALGVVPRALLQRRLRYRELAAISALAHILGYGVPGIALAMTGLGLEALVAATLGQAILELALLSLAQPYSKRPALDGDSLQQMLGFGSGLTLGNFFSFFALQADKLIAGRILGAELLGLYSRSHSLMATSTKLYSSVASTVLFPLLSRARENSAKIQRALRNGLAINAFILMPLSAMLFIAAPELIAALLGQEWRGAIDPFRVLVLALPFRGADRLSGPILMALGNVYRLAGVQAFFAVLVVAGAWVGTQNGVVGLAIGVATAIVLHSLALLQQAVSLTNSRWLSVLTPLLRPCAAALVSFAFAFVISLFGRYHEVPTPFIAAAVLLIPGSLLALGVLLAPRAVLGRELHETIRQVSGLRRLELTVSRLLGRTTDGSVAPKGD